MTYISKCHNAEAYFNYDKEHEYYVCTECEKECSIKDPTDVEPDENHS